MTRGSDAERLREVFARALEAAPTDREAVLAELCAGDAELLAEVTSLLAVDDSAQGFLEHRGGGDVEEWRRIGVPEGSGPDGPSRTFGPYRTGALLGLGGYGAVHLATDARTGARVALKVLRAATPALMTSLRREIQTLEGLRHPGIVRILDHGVEGGLPWYAMDLCPGETLRRCAFPTGARATSPASAWWTTRCREAASSERPAEPECEPPALRVEERLDLVRGLCDVLAYLHGEGIVHRDLKPENVIVQPGLVPVVVDFGLVERREIDGRESLEGQSEAGGTLAYMAPEQATGAAVDARADLYAIGCILYELLTSRLPFPPARVGALASRSARPAPPSHHVPALSRRLDELVLGLLEPDPERRIGHADHVAAVLASLGTGRRIFSHAPKPRPYLYRSPFVGRDEPLRDLKAALAAVEGGAGDMILLEGAAGSGKTRLAAEVAALAWQRGVRVLSGTPAPGGGVADVPLGALRPALRAAADAMRACRDASVRTRLAPHARVLLPYEPGFGELASADEADSLPPREAQERLWRCLSTVFLWLALEVPLMLVLDDAQRADALTVGFLRSLRRSGRLDARARLLVLLVATSEEAHGGLSSLGDEGVRRLPLERLPDAEARAVVRGMLAADHVPERLMRALLPRVDGSPLLIAEYLRLSIEDELLLRDDRGRWRVTVERSGELLDLPLPSSLRRWAARRLDGLSAQARRFLDAAAVLGRDLVPEAVAQIAGLPVGAVDAVVADLVRRRVLEDEAGGLRFAQRGFRDVVYETIAPSELPALHGAAARRVRVAPDAKGRQGELARHLVKAGDRAAAPACFLAAARDAVAHHAIEEAALHYRAALSLLPTPSTDSVATRLELARDVLYQQRRAEAVVDEGRTALAEARQLGLEDKAVEALAVTALGFIAARRMDEARAAYEEALARSQALGDRSAEGDLARRMGALEVDVGRMGEAEPLLERALAIHVETGDEIAQARSLVNLAAIDVRMRRLPSGRARLDRALAILGRRRHRRLEASALSMLGTLASIEGNVDEAVALLERSLGLARALGDLREEGLALVNLANCTQGEPCREALREAVQVLREVGDAWLLAEALNNLADCMAAEDRVDEARACYREALALLRRSNGRRREAEVEVFLGELEVSQGCFPEAAAHLAAGRAIHAELGFGRGEGRALVGLACLERYRGRLAEAAALVRTAEEILRRESDRVALARCLVEKGHIALAGGVAAHACIEELPLLAGTGGVLEGTRLDEAIGGLVDAAAALAKGGTLVCGELATSLPAALLQALGHD